MLIWKLPKIFLVKIDGLSLFPQLKPNEIFLACNLKKPHKGDYVIFEKKSSLWVKRVIEINEDLKKCLVNDNFQNYYSLNFEDIKGVLILKLF